MEELWTEFVIKQSMGMSGVCVAQILRATSGILGVDVVFASDVDGAEIGDMPLDRPIPIDVFLNACSAVKQFDCADIYLLKSTNDLGIASLEQFSNYPDAIRHSCATIRVVDGEYVYFYVRSDKSSLFRGRFDLLAEPIERRLDEFIFPM